MAVTYATSKDVSEITKHADKLFEQNKAKDLYNYLMQYKDMQLPEIQWRCSRACYKLSILPGIDKNEAKDLAYDSLAFAEHTLELDKDSFEGHKVMDSRGRHSLKSYMIFQG